MHRFKRILAAVDTSLDSSPAFIRATGLARRSGTQLTVVDIVPELPGFISSLVADLLLEYQEQHNARMGVLQRWASGESVVGTAKVLHGRPTSVLVREVLRGGHDLLVKDAHAEEGAEVLFGGIDLRLMRNCPCPVWMVSPSDRQSMRRILAAIDPQPTSEGRILNDQIIGLASSISTIDDCELHVVSVWQGLADFDWQLAVPHDDQLFEAAAKRVLDACLATGNAEIPIGQVHFERGSPGSVIAGLAANLNADLLVMGTVARTGVAGFLIGNAAERVLREVNCSMLTVKPLNFVSPIRLEDDSSPELFPSWNPA